MERLCPPSFICPITHEIMSDPVLCTDGHSYERHAIARWHLTHAFSPMTLKKIGQKTIMPNHALRKAIEEWIESNFKTVTCSDVTIGRRIGMGSCKTVSEGTFGGRQVAVLEMRGDGGFETECATIIRLGRHPHLVRFLATCMCPASAGAAGGGGGKQLVTELAQHGSHADLLEKREAEITTCHKIVIMQQIALGIEALAGEKMVHRDLATRNVLVFAFDPANPLATLVKVSDFGLSVSLYGRSHMTVAGTKIPFRWMPPEALEKRRFSEASDVWAFGDVLGDPNRRRHAFTPKLVLHLSLGSSPGLRARRSHWTSPITFGTSRCASTSVS